MHLAQILLTFFCGLLCNALPSMGKTVVVQSPDGHLCATLNDALGRVTLQLERDRQLLVAPSIIDLEGERLGNKRRFSNVRTKKGVRQDIKALNYRQRELHLFYNSATMRLSSTLEIELRAYNEGVAYRFSMIIRDSMVIDNELFDFNAAGAPVYYRAQTTNAKHPMAMAFQNRYTTGKLSEASDTLAFLPVTLDYGNRLKLTLLESDLEAYPGMFLTADKTTQTLRAVFAPYPKTTDYYPWRRQQHVTSTHDYIARIAGRRTLPWRIMAITTDDRQMPTNPLVYALASPSRVADTEWIKPGKSAWEWWNDWSITNVGFEAGINQQTYKHYIDFAARHGLEYMILDEGWYDPKSGNMLQTIPEINLPELINYSRERGVGIILWTVFNVLDDQLEEACTKYEKLGVKGFKVDFLDRDDQTAVEMTYRIAEACARHHLVLDLHGTYKPTGLDRTYPNVINVESVFGMEEVKWGEKTMDMPAYDVTFPFIRMMAGPVDFTPGAMRNASKTDWQAHYHQPMSMGTRAHQAAHYVVHDSPLTMLADAPTLYDQEPDYTRLIASVPTVWDETIIPLGEMSEYIVSARRLDGDWWIGAETSWKQREITIPLAFLAKGVDYEATILSDGPNAHKTASDYTITTRRVKSADTITLKLASGGGALVKIKEIR